MAENSVKDVKGYRADIDGLRAVAVISVLVYHAFPEQLPGGFVGVDVFFVISGFLISRIILSEIGNDTFTFTNFYSRRIRRIFPALFLVLAAVILIGWYTLLPTDFRKLGAHVLAGAGFFSNLLLYSEGGYFDTAAELKPLLHLWSLGIEEQYYLVWPLLLIGFRNNTRYVFWFITAIALASFLLSLWGSSRYPHATFYLPPTRFWELMIGGMLAYWSLYKQRGILGPVDKAWGLSIDHVASIAGISCVVIAFFAIRPDSDFPGWWALLPTLGTALLIIAGPPGTHKFAITVNQERGLYRSDKLSAISLALAALDVRSNNERWRTASGHVESGYSRWEFLVCCRDL